MRWSAALVVWGGLASGVGRAQSADPEPPPAGPAPGEPTTEPAPSPPASEPAPEPARESSGPAVPEDNPGSSADAVNDLPPPSFWEGGGLRIGDSTALHPSVSVGSGYQTNVFFQDANDAPAGPIASALLRFGVGASWATLSPGRMEIEAPTGDAARQRLAFSLDANLTWNQYLSSDADVKRVSDLGIGLLGDVKLNPQGAVSFEARDGFTRSVQPGQGVKENTNRDKNDLSALVHFKPGGGALELFLGYTFTLDIFEHGLLYYEDRTSHTGQLGARWQWLPQTLVLFDASISAVSPSNADYKSSSTPVRATLGISTLVTPAVGVLVNAGYGNGLYSSYENISTWLASVELRYAVGPTVRTALGYTHEFSDALIGNFQVDHSIFARATAQLTTRWQAHTRAEVRFRSYGGIRNTNTLQFCGDPACSQTRSDIVPRVEVGTDVALQPWLMLGAQYLFQMDSTDFYVLLEGAGRDNGAFKWHEVDLTLTARW
jgi:hypothetical protein